MKKLKENLRESEIYAESDLLYSYLKPSDWLKKEAEEIVNNYKIFTSVITVTEIEIVSKRDFGDDFADSVLEKLEKIKNIQFVSLDVDILKKAISYRKEFGLNIFDALHAASAFFIKKKLVSTDRVYELIDEIEKEDPRNLIEKRAGKI